MINPLKKVEVNHFTLRHPRIDARSAGMVIAHITDIHLGRWVKPRHVEDLSAYVNRHGVELAVLTGDYVGYDKRDLAPCVEALGALEAPAFATLGNHDHWASTALAEAAFSRSAVRLLSNVSEVFTSAQGRTVRLVGVDDAVTRHDDIPQAFAEAQDDLFRLTLCHVPSLGPKVAAAGADAILSGHTHGLQFNVPGMAKLLTTRLGIHYIGGGYLIDDTVLYVSRGLGSASWPWRYKASPELTFFTLQPGARPELTLEHRVQTSIAHPPSAHGRSRRMVQAALSAGDPAPLVADDDKSI